MYHPAVTSRTSGRAFEAMVERFALKRLKLHRPEASTRLGSAGASTVRALRPEGRPSRFEAQTVAEGLWVTRSGGLVWIECAGSADSARHPGLERSDSARKVAGTLNAVRGVCGYWHVSVPHFVIVTSHAPAPRSASSEYLYWAVIEPVGRENVDLYEIDPVGMVRQLALPGETDFA